MPFWLFQEPNDDITQDQNNVAALSLAILQGMTLPEIIMQQGMLIHWADSVHSWEEHSHNVLEKQGLQPLKAIDPLVRVYYIAC